MRAHRRAHMLFSTALTRSLADDRVPRARIHDAAAPLVQQCTKHEATHVYVQQSNHTVHMYSGTAVSPSLFRITRCTCTAAQQCHHRCFDHFPIHRDSNPNEASVPRLMCTKWVLASVVVCVIVFVFPRHVSCVSYYMHSGRPGGWFSW